VFGLKPEQKAKPKPTQNKTKTLLNSLQVRIDSLLPHVAFFAQRNIPRGEELTFDYGACSGNQTKVRIMLIFFLLFEIKIRNREGCHVAADQKIAGGPFLSIQNYLDFLYLCFLDQDKQPIKPSSKKERKENITKLNKMKTAKKGKEKKNEQGEQTKKGFKRPLSWHQHFPPVPFCLWCLGIVLQCFVAFLKPRCA